MSESGTNVEECLNTKTRRFIGQKTVGELNAYDGEAEDVAIVYGIPYDSENKCKGVRKVGTNGLEVRNGDYVMYDGNGAFLVIEDGLTEEYEFTELKDMAGNVIRLPFPVSVQVCKTDKKKDVNILLQVISQLVDKFEKTEEDNA